MALAQPEDEFPREPISVLASYFDGGAGPSHSVLGAVIASAGIDEGEGGGSKSWRVMHAFSLATVEQQYDLAEELLLLIRNNNGFANPTDWNRRARSAFRHAGGVLDEDGYLNWEHETEPQAGGWTMVTLPNTGAQIPVSSHGRTGQARQPANSVSLDDPTEPDKQIFLVHGHDEAARNEVEVFLSRTTGVTPVVLMLEPNRGLTVIEKFESYADQSSFAVILMTPDDLGKAKSSRQPANQRARQNVVFEFGYFVGVLRRAHVAALIWPDVEKPSDINGLVYIDYRGEWKEHLRAELRVAGFPIRN